MKRKSLNAQKINHNFLKKFLSQNHIKSVFSKFEKKLNHKESFLVAVSGGPDSLALAFCQNVMKRNMALILIIVLLIII